MFRVFLALNAGIFLQDLGLPNSLHMYIGDGDDLVGDHLMGVGLVAVHKHALFCEPLGIFCVLDLLGALASLSSFPFLCI